MCEEVLIFKKSLTKNFFRFWTTNEKGKFLTIFFFKFLDVLKTLSLF